jgi:ribosomal-protein-alanine N-acetyltransferase
VKPEAMAALYARAFPETRGWSAAEIEGLIGAPGGFAVTRDTGFAIGRAVAGEAELLTIAVAPEVLGRGIGRALLAAFEAEARRRDAATAFLEVAADNPAALALYRAAGWVESGRRRGYYRRARGTVDAVLMSKRLA